MTADIGRKAPDFIPPTDGGGTVTLSKLKGPVVLYFYPKDGTSGCTKEACDFRDAKEIIRRIWRKVKVPGHIEEVLAALKSP